MPSAALEIVLTILAALFWLVALAAHIILLKFLLTPYERIKLRLPAGSWPLLLSITIFDLVALLTALPFTTLFAIFDGWPFGELLCDLSTFVKVASLTMASYTILALLMQCYELIVKTSRPPLSTVKLGLLVGSLWLLALVTAIPMLYSHRVVYLDVHEAPVENMETFDFENRNYNLTQKMLEMKKESLLETVAASRPYCVPNHHLGFIFHSVMYLYLQFLIPTGIVIFLFIRITDTMNKAKSNKGNTLEIAQQHQPDVVQLPQNVKYVKSILILAVVFHLFWAPTNFFSLFIASNSVVWSYFEVLSEATYFIKPLILFAVNTNFQNALRTIGIPTTEVEDVDGYQVGFSKMEEAGVY